MHRSRSLRLAAMPAGPDPVLRLALGLAPRASLLALAGAVLAAIAVHWAGGMAGMLFATASATFAALLVLTVILRLRNDLREATLQRGLADFVSGDATPTFATDRDGIIQWRNPAAEAADGAGPARLAEVLAGQVAGPAALLHRLRSAAEKDGHAREDVVTARGHMRLSVHRLGHAGLLWRIEALGERSGPGAPSVSGLPSLVASASGTILFMNEPLRRLIGHRAASLTEVFPVLPVHGGDVCDLKTPAGPVRMLLAELARPGGRREIVLVPAPQRLAESAPGLTGLDALPVALLLLARDGTLKEANAAARALVGSVALGTPLSQILEGLGRPVNDWLADALAGRAEGRPEVLRLRGAGTDAFLQVTLSRTVTDAGTELLAILSDATKLKTLEAQFVQSQKMQAIGQLAGGIAHDFNNLLTAITGHCDLLLLRHQQADPDYADLVQINQNANRAASLVGQLLAFSRKQTLRPNVIDLRDALADLTHLLNRLVGEKIKLDLHHDTDLAPIRADRRQLEQVIMNLVVNARDAMPCGGTIRITTENLRLQTEVQRSRATVPPGDYVVVSVRDQGTGIAPDSIQKIFEPFYTTKRQGEGTGLGLSMAYGIVKQTGGFIFCDSTLGVGTTFQLFFPAHSGVAENEVEPQAAQPAAAPELPVAAQGDFTVLLVEDEAPVRAFAGRALRLRGYAVLEAEHAEAALALLADPDLRIDIFVTDVIMPGLDGPSWVARALERRPHTRVVFISGYAEESIAETRDRIPNSVFLPKPFSLADLTRTVDAQAARLRADQASVS